MITINKTNIGEENWSQKYWQWQKQPDEFVNSITEFIQ